MTARRSSGCRREHGVVSRSSLTVQCDELEELGAVAGHQLRSDAGDRGQGRVIPRSRGCDRLEHGVPRDPVRGDPQASRALQTPGLERCDELGGRGR